MRLRTTLIGLLVVLSLVLGSTVYAGFALHKDDIVESERANVNETAATISNNLHAKLEAKEQAVRIGSRSQGMAMHGSDAQERALNAFLSTSHFDGASVVARNGTVMAFDAARTNASEREAVVGADFGDREYVQAALDGHVFVSNPFEAASGNYVVVVSTPIRNGTTIVGTLNAAIHLSSPAVDQQSMFADLSHLADTRQSVAVTYESETLYASDGMTERSFRDTDRRARQTFRATNGVPQTEWVVVVESDRSFVADRVRAVSFVQAGGLLVVLCSVGAVGYWTYRTSIEQIAALRAGLSALEDGKYDANVSLSGTDEWDEIGERFARVGTRLEQRESQLRVLNRVLRHNVRNEMNVVLGHAESITSTDASEDVDATTHANAITAAARETLDISNNARVIEDRIREATRTREPRPLSSVVAEATALADGPTDARVSVDVPEGVVVADGNAVRTALAELVENARMHSDRKPTDREVIVSATDDGDRVQIAVADNGPGLPGIERDLVAGELDATPVDHGEGLGLWIARWLVERTHGSIRATVTDHGTTVHVTVPTVYDDD